MKLRLFVIAMCTAAAAMAQTRKEVNLEQWQFSHDGQTWEQVSVPHDWAIAGPFDKKWDLQVVRIEQNGEKEATEKSGRSGSLPWIGKGVYRTTFSVPADYGHAELLFDGAMAEPEVWVNGRKAGYWAYGYNAFRVDVTNFLNGGENRLEVRLSNVEESSRWYPGAGIYRPVTLVMTQPTRIDDWSLYVRTMGINVINRNYQSLKYMGALLGLAQVEPCAARNHIVAVVDEVREQLSECERVRPSVNQSHIVHAERRLQLGEFV